MKIGDKLPDLLGTDQNGNEVKLSDYAGRKLILYAYPKDNTPGCTAEACSLRDNITELEAQGYSVVGVSKDSAQSHQRFIEKFGLPFTLVSDKETTLLQQMGAWGEKKMCGKTCIGTLRTTIIADERGIVTHIFTPKEINTKTHAEQILRLSISD